MLAIQKYIKLHGIDKTIADFKLKSRFYENKVLLKYDQLVSPTLMALPEMQDCRGLILDRNDFSVMCLAFRKFFNAEEGNAHKIDWSTAEIFEKLDGSMMQVYWDKYANKWFAATSGTGEGEGEVNNKMGTTFNELFWKTIEDKYPNFKIEYLDKRCCYVFELTTPYNIVVKPHGESSSTILTARNLDTLKEASRKELIEACHALHLPIVKSYDLNASDIGFLKRSLEDMPWSDEGYVVCDANHNRVKVKNPAYVAVHHMKGKSAEHNILVIIKSNEIEEFAATFPDRKDELYKLKENYDKLIADLTIVWNELQEFRPKNIMPAEKKKYAAAVFEVCKKHGKEMFTGLYFSLNEEKVASIDDYMLAYDDKALYKIL